MKIELNKVYEDGEGSQWKIVAIDNDRIFQGVAINKNQNDYRMFTKEGWVTTWKKSSDDLRELIGDDFTIEDNFNDCISERVSFDETLAKKRAVDLFVLTNKGK